MKSTRSTTLCLFAILLLTLSYLLVGTTQPNPPERSGIHGRVMGPHGPMAFASVRIKGTSRETLTDREGRFAFPLSQINSGRVTVAEHGFFIAGAPITRSPLELLLEPLPSQDNPDYHWVDPAPDPNRDLACANCHEQIYNEWQTSGHSRSATGKHFVNLYEGTDWEGKKTLAWGLLDEHNAGSGVCAFCHAPSLKPGDPANLDLTKVTGVPAKGVHCDYCHKIESADTNRVTEFGRFGLNLRRPSEHQLFFGPLDDVDRGEDAHAPIYKESRYCASCHEGIVFGVHVYSTYTEWLASPASRRNQHCQDCHLTPTGRMTNIAPGHGGIERDPRTLGNHRFWNGSQRSMLKRSLKVSVDFTRKQKSVEAKLELMANGVGHRVPTGFVDRQLILIVNAEDAQGTSVKPLGDSPTLTDAVGPELSGKTGRLYAKLLLDAEGNGPVPFWIADGEVVDTRLYPEKPDVMRLSYPPKVAKMRVRVLYRKFWYETIQIKAWPDRDLVVIDREFIVE